MTWKLAWMLRTYRIYNSMVRFLKYEFYNKLLGGVTLLRVTPCVTWTQPIYIYIYIYILVQIIQSYILNLKLINLPNQFLQLISNQFLKQNIKSQYWNPKLTLAIYYTLFLAFTINRFLFPPLSCCFVFSSLTFLKSWRSFSF